MTINENEIRRIVDASEASNDYCNMLNDLAQPDHSHVEAKEQLYGSMFNIASKTLRMRSQPLWRRVIWAIRGFD